MGKTDGMKGHVFRLRSETKSVLEFTKTMEQLIRYVTANYKRSDDIKWMLKNMEETKFEIPKELSEIPDEKIRERVLN